MAKRVYKQAEETNEDRARKIQRLIWQHQGEIEKRAVDIASFERRVAAGKITMDRVWGDKPHQTVAWKIEQDNKFIVEYTAIIAELTQQMTALQSV